MKKIHFKRIHALRLEKWVPDRDIPVKFHGNTHLNDDIIMEMAGILRLGMHKKKIIILYYENMFLE